MYQYIFLLHVLSATVWTGGHLVLAVTVLPRALKAGDPRILLDFESGFERIGLPALLIQVATGLWMAQRLVPDCVDWFNMAESPARLVGIKLLLLVITVVAALDARLRLIPRLDARTLPAMARRIYLVTVVSILFVVAGVSFRGGLLA
jgi:putative copper export protein